MNGELKAIWVKRMKGGPMDARNKVSLIKDKGIVDNANQGGKRQITIMEQEVWEELMTELGGNLDPSTRRANILISGVPLKDSRGKVLQIGNCQVEIIGETKPCEQMEAALSGLKSEMFPNWRGGAYGTILNDGEIEIGDKVQFI